MNQINTPVSQALVQARKALERGDRRNARLLAEMAAEKAPNLEEPWLILASVSSPRESIYFLKKAMVVNPQSRLARRGMHWAIARLRQELEITPPENRVEARPITEIAEKTRSKQPSTSYPVPAAQTARVEIQLKRPVKDRKGSKRKLTWWPVVTLVIAACLVAGIWAIWPGNMLVANAFLSEKFNNPMETQILPAAPADVRKPTYTATFTPSPSPTPTLTPTPTATETPLPTLTPLPSDTPWPTWTPAPTQVLMPPGSGGERWIDVNLSQQMVYAYEGNSIMASFLVSTGTWLHPTVTGQFNIYIKLLYTDMAGPGYYLPDVPNTMYFFSGYALHGTYWHSNFGTPMSHGCINLTIPDSAWLFNFASVGTLVNIHY